MQALEKSRIIYVLKHFHCDSFLSQRSHCSRTVQDYYVQIFKYNFILIFPYMLWFHARYENIMKNVSISSQHEILETRHFTHSEVWAFPRPSEQIFLINRPLRAPRKLSWVCTIEMIIKKVKTPFYQPSSFYLEMIIAHNTKQPKFPRCRCLSMFRRLPSIIPRVHCKLKRITGQLSETQGRHRLE